MITMMEIDRDGKRYWTATGKGPLRKIVAEGDSRGEARMEWHKIAMAQRQEREDRILYGQRGPK